MKITVRQLEAFAAIARHSNLTDAASELSLTKGALSQALQQLEQRLSTPLFDRVHPRLKLNSEGLALQPLVEEALTRLGDIEAHFDPEHIHAGQLRLGASQTIGNYLLPRLIADCSREGRLIPDIRITNTHNLCELLQAFEIDLALIEGESHLPELITEEWLEDEMLVVAAPDHPLCRQDEIHAEALAGQIWILREAHSGSREQFDRQLRPLFSHCGQIVQLNTLEAVMLTVEQGVGLSFISHLAASDRIREGKLKALPITRHFPRKLRLVWHSKKFHSAALKSFLQMCRGFGGGDQHQH
ncbi:LysR family transcriptional regulator [Pokkaliibacter plantistimulans]|uniref:LysR family transcriptional regulator n=1 Tax=Proteobacteria bacterium 228 TaxID=2083153 RepID=A0A2S5KQ66_9PROT|nr:LysR family transcriptional regulator [Pokkaliibacter plantistimulans]